MTETQVREKLARFGLQLKPRTLQAWAKKWLIRPPEAKVWSIWGYAEAMAVAYLLRRGWDPRRLAHYRSAFALELERDLNPAVAFYNGPDSEPLLPENSPSREEAFTWLLCVLKARLELPLGQPATILIRYSFPFGQVPASHLDRTVSYEAGPPVQINQEGIGPRFVDRLRSGFHAGDGLP